MSMSLALLHQLKNLIWRNDDLLYSFIPTIRIMAAHYYQHHAIHYLLQFTNNHSSFDILMNLLIQVSE